MSASWSILEYRGQAGMQQLKADWHRLVAEMPGHGFHHLFETHEAYFARMPSPHGPFTCLALSDGDAIRAICPLEPDVVPILGRKARVWNLPLGQRDLPRDVICPPGEARRMLIPQVVRFLARSPERRPWLVLDRVPQSSCAWEAVQAVNRASYSEHVIDTSHFFNCEHPFEELSARLSKNFRGNLRKARNKLSALANVRFEAATDVTSVRGAFEAFVALEASGWKGEERTTLQDRPDHLSLYRDVVETIRNGDRCELNGLYVGDRCIAMQLCVRSGAEYAIPKIAYDEEFARMAPGQLLLEWTLRRCCADPAVKRLNLMSGAAWHLDWRPESDPLHCVYVPLRGRLQRPLAELLRLRLHYGPRLRRWLRRIRPEQTGRSSAS